MQQLIIICVFKDVCLALQMLVVVLLELNLAATRAVSMTEFFPEPESSQSGSAKIAGKSLRPLAVDFIALLHKV